MLRRLGDDPAERALAARTHARLVGDPGPLRAAARQTGAVLALADDAGHLSGAVAGARSLGARVEPLDRPADLAPALAGAPLKRAWHLPDELVICPHTLHTALLAAHRAAGGELRCGVEVGALLREGDRVVGVVTSAGPLRAGAVAIAAGAWAAALAPAGSPERPLIPLRRSLLQTRQHALSSPGHPWVWIDDVGLYARPEGGGWLVSACDEAVERAPAPRPSRGPVDEWHRALAAEKLARWMPALADARPASGWTGLRTFAPDRAPVLGPDPAHPGLLWMAGLGGSGLSCGLGAAEAVAAWHLGDAVPWLRPDEVSPGRAHLRRWPIRPDGHLHRARLVDGASPRPLVPRVR
jgi:glycine/D-amino acid oxidase-like deaminating enzyme